MSRELNLDCLGDLGWKEIPDLTHGMGQRWWVGFTKGEYTLKECSAWDENLIIFKNDREIFSGDVYTVEKLKIILKQIVI